MRSGNITMKHLKAALSAFFAVIGIHALLFSVFFALLYLAHLPDAAMIVSSVLGVAAVVGWFFLERSICLRTGAHRAVFPLAILVSSLIALLLDRLALNLLDASVLQNAGFRHVYSFFLFILLWLMTALFFIIRILIELISRARRSLNRR